MQDEKTDSDRPGVVLRVIGGPNIGNEFELDGDTMSLGRGSEADIVLEDNLISRQHVRLRRVGDDWCVEDMGSTNGTWVRGTRINAGSSSELDPGTAVRVGNTLFELYYVRGEDVPELDESMIACRIDPISSGTLTLDTSAEQYEVGHAGLKLAAIYRVQGLLVSNFDEQELYHQILETISTVIPSDQSYLFLNRADEQELSLVVGHEGESRMNSIKGAEVSYSIINYAKGHMEAILSEDAQMDERFDGQSIADLNVHSVMCVPMIGSQEGLCGILYLSVSRASLRYKEEDLQLLSAIAHAAGLSVENRRLMEINIQAERMAAIGLAAASLSHYVKNILAGLEGSISLLRIGMDSNDEAVMNDAWEILSKNHKRLSKMVLDLLNLSKDDEELELELHNLTDIIQDAVALTRAQVTSNNIGVTFDEASAATVIMADIDSRGMHRVMLNLLNNSVDAVREKHSSSGEGEILVIVDEDFGMQLVRISVKDNGIGIAPDNVDRIFDLFYSSKGDRGTGLGLAVTKRIVEKHRGTIALSANNGGGCIATVTLPVRGIDTSTMRWKRPKLDDAGTESAVMKPEKTLPK